MTDKPNPTMHSVYDMRHAALQFREEVGDRDHILIGPALIYGEDVAFIAIAGTPGYVGTIKLGEYHEGLSPEYAALFDNVIEIRKGNSFTLEEGRKSHGEFVKACTSLYRVIEVFDSDKALVRAYVDRFPCAEADALAREILG